ncbi:septum formation initiator family protein [Desulfosoma caldarium]|uniref:Cell division protein FtsB n=1 Tax=Desulfosoma caldarium TaxID=610254 RepID=A0A3N1UQI1_9BACT|nr:septum formation initiator family protein [Desulfosoma caldarium]ROQ90990.1 cell division protein FtsB [Desulfosoma caldarium]
MGRWDWHDAVGRWGTIVLVAFLAALDLWLFRTVFLSPKGLKGYQVKRRQVVEMQEQLTALRKETQQLYLKTQRFKEDPHYAERFLRQNLDLIRDGEILIRFLPKAQKTSAPDKATR